MPFRLRFEQNQNKVEDEEEEEEEKRIRKKKSLINFEIANSFFIFKIERFELRSVSRTSFHHFKQRLYLNDFNISLFNRL